MSNFSKKRTGKQTEREAWGMHAESLAAFWVEEQGGQILARNYRCRGGELDIIAHFAASQTLVFFEVRSLRNASPERAIASVTWAKQQRLQHAARHYLAKRPEHCAEIAFESIGVNFLNDGSIAILKQPLELW